MLIKLFESALILILRGGAVNDPARQYVCRPHTNVPEELAGWSAPIRPTFTQEKCSGRWTGKGSAAEFGDRRCFKALKCDRIGNGATLSRRQASRFASHLSARRDSNLLDVVLVKTEIRVTIFANEKFVHPGEPKPEFVT